MAKLIKLIETDELRGLGTTADPFRAVTQYWTADGSLVTESDPYVRTVLTDALRSLEDIERAFPGQVGFVTRQDHIAKIKAVLARDGVRGDMV